MSDTDSIIVINVFDVPAAQQQELVDLLAEGTERVIRHRPGFRSVTLLASNDGSRVVNYAEWRGLDDVKATMAAPDVQAYAGRAAEIAEASPNVYSIAGVHRA